MNPSAMTAAHRSLPFGTKVRVTNQKNGRSVVVRINDRGPFVKGRFLDLSRGAAQQLGFISSGHTSVCMAQDLDGTQTDRSSPPPFRPLRRRGSDPIPARQ